MITIKMEGMETILKDLRKAQVDVQEEARAVLKEQAEAIRDDAKSRCNFGDGDTKRKGRKRSTGALRESIRASVSRKGLGGSVSAGGRVKGASAFYAKFIEFGTKNSPAQPFLYPAARAHEEETKEKLTKVLTDAIKKGVEG